ncbi:uncharacterized protein LOC128562036 [Nycticebus coucang]|uniref:uncharacterized protein LOC128562036 n=1 Tax=Nycticebus coucang TaxID=9470 RepID=UPI00234CCEE2|nr:uncharacterized protein LOC128562036 [Nycticebus coucang]
MVAQGSLAFRYPGVSQSPWVPDTAPSSKVCLKVNLAELSSSGGQICQPPYQGIKKRISEMIDYFRKEKREHVPNMSIWGQKDHITTCAEMNKMTSSDIIKTTWAKIKFERCQKIKNSNLSGNEKHDLWESKHGALRFRIKNILNNGEELYLKEKETKFKMAKTTADYISERKLRKNLQLSESERQQFQVDNTLRCAREKIRIYKKIIDNMTEQQHQADLKYRLQMGTSNRRAAHYWLKTKILERQKAEQSWEAACLRRRLEIMELLHGLQTPLWKKPSTQDTVRRVKAPGKSELHHVSAHFLGHIVQFSCGWDLTQRPHD